MYYIYLCVVSKVHVLAQRQRRFGGQGLLDVHTGRVHLKFFKELDVRVLKKVIHQVSEKWRRSGFWKV
jgi:hypothetical protein